MCIIKEYIFDNFTAPNTHRTTVWPAAALPPPPPPASEASALRLRRTGARRRRETRAIVIVLTASVVRQSQTGARVRETRVIICKKRRSRWKHWKECYVERTEQSRRKINVGAVSRNPHHRQTDRYSNYWLWFAVAKLGVPCNASKTDNPWPRGLELLGTLS